MKTILLAAAAALTLNAGVALADNGDSFDFNSGTMPARLMQTAQSMQPQLALPADAPSVVIGHSVSQTRDTRTGSVFDPINWGSG